MKKIFSILYVLSIHTLLIVALVKNDFIQKVEIKLGMTEPSSTNHSYYMDALGWNFANRSNTIIDGDGLVFVGDSITNGLSVETIFGAVNYGISGDSVKNAKKRVKKYSHLENKTIVVALGVNDILRENDKIVSDYSSLIENLPNSSLVLVSSILPIDELRLERYSKTKKTNNQINELNAQLQNIASKFSNAHYIDSAKYMRDTSGCLFENFHNGDGLHLNTEGYGMWVKGLKEEFKKIVEQGNGDNALRRASL